MSTPCTDIMEEGGQRLGLALDQAALARLDRYFSELRKWNRTFNLVAKAPEREILETHFLDSLTLLALIPDPSGETLLDVGSGAGFPGLALKLARPELEVALVEPRQKRVSFLRQVIRTLGVEGVRVYEERLEPGQDTLGGEARRFSLITSRAFTTIAPFLALAAPFSPPGGRVICMKGPKGAAEAAQWQAEQPESPYRLIATRAFTLPFSGADRQLLVFEKAAEGRRATA